MQQEAVNIIWLREEKIHYKKKRKLSWKDMIMWLLSNEVTYKFLIYLDTIEKVISDSEKFPELV